MSQYQLPLFGPPPRPGAYSQEPHMSSRRTEKYARRSASPFGFNEPPSRHMPAPRLNYLKTAPEGYTIHEWKNGYYHGLLRRFPSGFPIGDGPYMVISIVSDDQSARHDWREFQELKNHLVGQEWEGLELYPAESRLQDPSNCFYLFCVPLGVILWGSQAGDRIVKHPAEAIAPQRPFPPPE